MPAFRQAVGIILGVSWLIAGLQIFLPLNLAIRPLGIYHRDTEAATQNSAPTRFLTAALFVKTEDPEQMSIHGNWLNYSQSLEWNTGQQEKKKKKEEDVFDILTCCNLQEIGDTERYIYIYDFVKSSGRGEDRYLFVCMHKNLSGRMN